MTQADLERAVHRIRWTKNAKARMEQALRLSPTQNTVGLELENHEKYAYTLQDAFVRKEQNMKRNYKKAVISAAAACLVIGVFSGGLFLHHKLTNRPSEPGSHSDTDNPGKNQKTLVLTDDADSFSTSLPAASEHGSYYIYDQLQSGVFYEVMYHDDETGKSLPLCAKPECRHDGNEYCVATTKHYYITTMNAKNTGCVYYNGYVYAAATRYDVPPENIDSNPSLQGVLLRYAPDGTEVTELCTLTDRAHNGVQCQLLLHRGCLIIEVNYSDTPADEKGDMTLIEATTGGYQIVGYDIANRTLVTLAEMPESLIGTSSLDMPESWQCVGDTLYLQKPMNAHWADPLRDGIYAVNLLTGESRRLVIKSSGDFVVTPQDIYYAESRGSEYIIHRFDLESGEDSEISHKRWYNFSYDGTYIYAEAADSWDAANSQYSVVVLNSDFEQVASVPFSQSTYFFPSASSGMLYVNTYDKMWRCPLADALAGNAKWEEYYRRQGEYEIPDMNNAE